MTGCLPRQIAPRLARALGRLPVVVLSGLRQTGKSTLLQHESAVAEGRAFQTLDDFATLAGLRAFVDRTPNCAAAILAYNGREAVKLDGKLLAIPLGHLLA